MEQLKLLIIHKIQFMRQYEQKKLLDINNRSQSQFLHQLLLQKKKIHLASPIQQKIIHSILGKSIEAPYRLLQFYQQSKMIMKAYNQQFYTDSDKDERIKCQKSDKNEQETTSQFKLEKHLSSNVICKPTLILKTIKLYEEFFYAEDNSQKAQQIYHLYKKKLCPSGLMLPTIFCWLSEWIKKQFSQFLKKQIKQLTINKVKEHNKIICLNQSKKKSIKNINFCSRTNSQQQNEYNTLKIQSSKQQLYKSIQLIRDRSQKAKQMLNTPIFVTLQTHKQKNIYISLSNEKLLLKSQISQKNISSFEKATLQDLEQKLLINRQIIVGAYYDRFTSYYKKLQSSIPDIDFQFIKQIKRNDKKNQIKKKIKQISRSLAIHQAQIKNSIQTYALQYLSKEQQFKLKKREKKRKKRNNKQVVNQQYSLNQNQGKNNEKPFSTIYNYQLQRLKSCEIQSSLLKNQTSQSKIKNKNQQSIIQKKQLSKPFQLYLNLPKIPLSKYGLILKGKSKMVLINSGRYKFQAGELKRQKMTRRSIDLGNIKQSQNRQNFIQFQSITTSIRQSKVKSKFKKNLKLIDKLLTNTQNPQKEQESLKLKIYQRQLVQKNKSSKKRQKQQTKLSLSIVKQKGAFQTIDYKIEGWNESY